MNYLSIMLHSALDQQLATIIVVVMCCINMCTWADNTDGPHFENQLMLIALIVVDMCWVKLWPWINIAIGRC